MMTLTLSHAANPDVRGGYWDGKPDCPKMQKVEVANLSEASMKLRAWVNAWGIGGGNLPKSCGDVRDGRKLVAHVSFNGRVWAPNGEEITI